MSACEKWGGTGLPLRAWRRFGRDDKLRLEAGSLLFTDKTERRSFGRLRGFRMTGLGGGGVGLADDDVAD
jgi:hypothetical protein